MGCKFCFATFQDVKRKFNLPKGHLSEEDALAVVDELASIGFEKITFAGGEPTLCPWLDKLIARAKRHGMTTMVVTNGSRLDEETLRRFRPHLDWIAISIDSLNHSINQASGRVLRGASGNTPMDYYSIVERVKAHGFGLKINTVIHSANLDEDFTAFIRHAKPKRWKLFQVLPMIGQNSEHIEDFKISTEDFLRFVDRHSHLEQVTDLVPETNEDIKGSYAMVSPAGQFFDNVDGMHRYSKPILEFGARLAIQQMRYDFEKFLERKGQYDWVRKQEIPKRITLSGEVASGKSRVGRELANKLGYEFISIGERTREFAREHRMSIVDFQRKCCEDPELDKAIDKEFSTECSTREGLVIDYRLGFKFVANAYHIFLRVSDTVAIERLKSANRDNETHRTIGERNASFRKQFIAAYGVDYTLEKHYDLIIDVDDLSIDEIVNQVLATVNQFTFAQY